MPPTIEIINPIKNSLYLKNLYILELNNKTIIYGETNVSVSADDDVGINKVEFYLDDTLQYTDYNEPYTWKIPKGHLKHTLNVKAYDIIGQETNDQLDFLQWKIHPIIIFSLILLIKNKELNLDWINNEEKWNSLLLKLLENLRGDDTLINRDIKDIIEYLKRSTEKIKTKIIIEYLNNHPYLKNKFKESYPIIYIILFYIKNEDSILKERILKEFYKNNNLLNILFSIKSKGDSTEFSNSIIQNLIDSKSIQWIKNHPYISLGLLLIYLLLMNQLLSSEENSQENQNEESNEQNREPIAYIEGPKIGIINSPINFSAKKSYDSDGNILKYNWDFGDGSSGSGIEIQHTYLIPGYYKIILSIIDDEGKTNYDYLNIEIVDSKDEIKDSNDNQNIEYLIISGILSTILLLGLIGLKLRRNFFE